MRAGRGGGHRRWNGAAFESSTAVFTNSKEAGRGWKGEGGMKQDAKARQVYGLRSRLLSLPLVERYTDAGREPSSSTYLPTSTYPLRFAIIVVIPGSLGYILNKILL